MKALIALIHARNLEYIRDKSALGWSLFFPILLVIAISIVFNNKGTDIYKLGVLNSTEQVSALSDIRYVQFINYTDKQKALSKVAKHQLDMLIFDEGYSVNPENKNGYILQQLLISKAPEMVQHEIPGKVYSHVEWYLPGILGMNIMFSSLFGVGYIVIRYRRTGVLKRMKVTPLKGWHFLYSQLFSRLITTLASSSLIFITLALLFRIKIEGSLWILLLSTTLGTASMIAISLLVTCRTRSDELGNGILNMISWPMMFLSGVWFSLEGSSGWVLYLSELLPLTHMNNINRAVISSGSTLSEVTFDLIALLVTTVLCMLAAQLRFKWE